MNGRFIVAEVSKNWEHGNTKEGSLLSQRFELVINTNFDRGYKLSDWKLNVFMDNENGIVNETIIAIFEKIQDAAV